MNNTYKVVCISKDSDILILKHGKNVYESQYKNWLTSYLEIGKSYDVIDALLDDSILYYTIKTKNGTQGWIPRDIFVTLSEWREIQLNKIEI
jgi:hypothetical protein